MKKHKAQDSHTNLSPKHHGRHGAGALDPLLSAVLFFFALALSLDAARSLIPARTWSAVDYGRVFVVAFVLAVAGLSLIRYKKTRFSVLNRIIPVASKLRAAVIVAWGICFCALEPRGLGVDRAMTLVIISVGLMYWERVGLFVFTAGSLTLVAVLADILGRGANPDSLFLLAGAFVLSSAIVRVIRRNMMPGEERVRSLEEENKELWNLSFKDSLTGLYNRRFANETGIALFQRALRYREDLHVLMIDIDHFKRVNDELSHAVGDIVLSGVAAAMLNCVRTSDICARYGGEEFLVILPLAEPELAQAIANRIRNTIANDPFKEVPWRITVSVGVTGLQEGDSFESLVDRADRHLYRAKRSGRNRVEGV
jgi:diguanylate cyclase (GGDEF)-like protein